MGQKAKNAGKKKQMPPKAKVSCVPKNLITCSDTPEAHEAIRELIMDYTSSGFDLYGNKCGHQQRNFSGIKYKNHYQEF